MPDHLRFYRILQKSIAFYSFVFQDLKSKCFQQLCYWKIFPLIFFLNTDMFYQWSRYMCWFIYYLDLVCENILEVYFLPLLKDRNWSTLLWYLWNVLLKNIALIEKNFVFFQINLYKLTLKWTLCWQKSISWN